VARPPGSAAEQARSFLRIAGGDDPVLAAAAERALGALDARGRHEAAMDLLHDRDPGVLRASARALGEVGDEEALTPLILSAARDVDAEVRREAALSAASFGHDDTAIPFVRALGSSNPRIVARAAEALARIGDVRALPYIVKRLRSHGSSSRSYVAFTNQVSYVRDYDVEIAQASNIANPEVAIIHEGVVLDVKVLDAGYEKTWVEPVLVEAAGRLAGRPFAGAEDVARWWAENGDAIPGFPERSAGRKRRGTVVGVPRAGN
jgi:HEAT repeat protein